MEDYDKVKMERRRGKQGCCYRLYKRLTSYGGCVLMKTFKFKVKVSYGLEAPDSAGSFTPCLIVYCRFITKCLQSMQETLLYKPCL